MATNFVVNGRPASTDAPPATPLLWVIREQLKLTGTKFGCGTGLCGACTIHIDGKRAFSCQIQVSEIAGKSVTTIEGLSPDSSHPLQKAWLAAQVPQCGYCQSGQIMSAAALLKDNSEADARADRRAHERQHLPLRDLSAHRRRGRTRRAGGLSHDKYEQHRLPTFPQVSRRQSLAPSGHGRRRRPHLRARAPGRGARRGAVERTHRQGVQSVALDRARRHHHHHVGGRRNGTGLDDVAAAGAGGGARRRLVEGAHRAGAADRQALCQSRLRHDLHRRQQCGAGLFSAACASSARRHAACCSTMPPRSSAFRSRS